MRKIILSFWILSIITSCKHKVPVTTIAFGSCGEQDKPQPILSLAASYKPDVFIFLGDNIYGDTDNMDTLENKYKRWMSKPEFKELRQSTRILATWDDHDYGMNDAGKHYAYKEKSKEIFMKYFNIPDSHEIRKHPGIYHTEYIQEDGKTIQFILLDVRTFRSNLILFEPGKMKVDELNLPRKNYFYTLDYLPYTSADSTLLGEEQWAWLKQQLLKPADLRFICSGSQFGIEYNGYECWANFPHEKQRMLNMIKETKAEGVVFLSGDVHYAEISKLNEPGLYPIYDITSSGITSQWDFATLNSNRIEGPVMDNHFGLLTIYWENNPVIKAEIIDKYNNQRIEYTINKSALTFTMQ